MATKKTKLSPGLISAPVKEKPINGKFNGKQFSKDIIETRTRRDLSQAAAAKIAGVPPTIIHDAEAKCSVSLKNLPGICNLLGKPVQYYFTSK